VTQWIDATRSSLGQHKLASAGGAALLLLGGAYLIRRRKA